MQYILAESMEDLLNWIRVMKGYEYIKFFFNGFGQLQITCKYNPDDKEAECKSYENWLLEMRQYQQNMEGGE